MQSFFYPQILAFKLAVLALSIVPLAQAQTADEKNNIEVFKRAKHSVVYVTTNQLVRDIFSFDVVEMPQGTGTGFVWNEAGVIVTNFHVIQGANSISVKFSDPTTYKAEIVGIAPDKDIAILKVQAPKEKFAPIPLGNSATLEVGNKVLAIGNPFGLDQTLTTGVVSALGRQITSPANKTISGVIQTDAAINPGNSGGPLLNSQGELIGMNTAIVSKSGGSAGIGFAIPINEIKRIVPQLITYGKIRRASLGLRYVDDSIAERYGFSGVLVAQVLRNSSAERAGIEGLRRISNGRVQVGDEIVAIDQKRVSTTDDIYQILENKKENEEVLITTQKNRQRFSYKLTLQYLDDWY